MAWYEVHKSITVPFLVAAATADEALQKVAELTWEWTGELGDGSPVQDLIAFVDESLPCDEIPEIFELSSLFNKEEVYALPRDIAGNLYSDELAYFKVLLKESEPQEGETCDK